MLPCSLFCNKLLSVLQSEAQSTMSTNDDLQSCLNDNNGNICNILILPQFVFYLHCHQYTEFTPNIYREKGGGQPG